MPGWTLEDIPWDAFDPSRVDPEIVPLVKAASMVEYNSGDYRTYLHNVFHDDPRVLRAVDGWADEELQHGLALARWARLADPDFDFEARFARFVKGFRLPLEAERSVRGTRTGELIARCMVETGTSSYYAALAAATDEPVLKAICERIASDEVAHYWLFHNYMTRYMKRERLGFLKRLRVALARIAESEDDELAYAYYAANTAPSAPYDRRQCARAYARRAICYYSPPQVRRAISMILAAIGLEAESWVSRALTAIACRVLRLRQRLIARTGGLAAGV